MGMGITLSDVAAILGMILGTAGFVLGILNYLRDRSKVRVLLNWDWVIYGDASVDQSKKWAVIRVYNEGRRPVYVTHVLIALPKGYDEEGHLLIKESMRGAKLDEGDRPELYKMTQEGMEKYAKDWKRLRAEVLCSNNHFSVWTYYYPVQRRLLNPTSISKSFFWFLETDLQGSQHS